MFNVCPQCGEYLEEKAIDVRGPFAICPVCGYAHHFERLPLFIVSDASGSGKSTLALALVRQLHECVVMESDILWLPEFDTPEDGYRAYRNLWLRLAKNISQSGRPVVLIGSAVPEQFEACSERRYFGELHYLVLVADDDILEERLRARPAWRRSATADALATMLEFNRWLRQHAATATPPMALLNTSQQSVTHTMAWVHQYWPLQSVQQERTTM
ncbi:MAG: AAA family ATPase [Ktedonobacterales bacterium]